MKILLVSDSNRLTDGVSFHVAAEVAHFQQAGHQVALVSTRSAYTCDYYVSAFAPYYRQFWSPPNRLGRRLKREFGTFDVVYGQSVAPNGLALGLFLSAYFAAPYVNRLHTYPPDYFTYCYPAGSPSWLKATIRITLTLLLTACCASMAQVVASLGSPTFLGYMKRVLRVRGSRVAINRIPVGTPVPARARPAPPADKAYPYVFLTVARVSPEKNHRFLAQMWNAHLQRTYPNARWRVVGDGPALRELERVLAARSRVDLLGSVSREQVFTELAGADLMLYASRSEAFGMVILEAKAAGLPVIALSDQSAVEQQLAVGALRAGLVTESDFAATVKRILADPHLYRRMSREGQDDVSRNYSDQQLEKMALILAAACGVRLRWAARIRARATSWLIRRLLWTVPRHLMSFYRKIPFTQKMG